MPQIQSFCGEISEFGHLCVNKKYKGMQKVLKSVCEHFVVLTGVCRREELHASIQGDISTLGQGVF